MQTKGALSENKTMTVRENLRLCSGEDTSTQVLAVMSAGAKVRILELGRAETIASCRLTRKHTEESQ